jgi:hypothetical protein
VVGRQFVRPALAFLDHDDLHLLRKLGVLRLGEPE